MNIFSCTRGEKEREEDFHVKSKLTTYWFGSLKRTEQLYGSSSPGRINAPAGHNAWGAGVEQSPLKDTLIAGQ